MDPQASRVPKKQGSPKGEHAEYPSLQSSPGLSGTRWTSLLGLQRRGSQPLPVLQDQELQILTQTHLRKARGAWQVIGTCFLK